jgi:hypothetical protein
VERAHSNWTHLWSAGLDPIGDFVQACADEDHRLGARYFGTRQVAGILTLWLTTPHGIALSTMR